MSEFITLILFIQILILYTITFLNLLIYSTKIDLSASLYMRFMYSWVNLLLLSTVMKVLSFFFYISSSTVQMWSTSFSLSFSCLFILIFHFDTSCHFFFTNFEKFSFKNMYIWLSTFDKYRKLSLKKLA